MVCWEACHGRGQSVAAQGLGKAVGTSARACSFAVGAAVLTADGERVPIEDISPGDEVVATDPETGERVTRTVDASWSHVDQTVTISIDDRELVTTEDHRFWSQTAGAFVPACDLEVGEKVVGDHGLVHTVTRTAEVGGYERVWNLSIDQVHTYHVGDTDTLVHNTCYLPGLPSTAPVPLGRENTGRTVPKNLHEQLAMTEVRSNPAGDIIPLKVGDSRWPGEMGWVKFRQDVNGVEIHYVKNVVDGAVDDFKFK